ncbi:unnamed protein product [Allacma fusca]|uniref:Elongation factor EFG domain-containing protein n=1 Tax=Allacma fusca TaxID=39272 RepID=A0A8J2PRI8_9HEXA|nr:unnamed protein product [Allacma fusca]
MELLEVISEVKGWDFICEMTGEASVDLGVGSQVCLPCVVGLGTPGTSRYQYRALYQLLYGTGCFRAIFLGIKSGWCKDGDAAYLIACEEGKRPLRMEGWSIPRKLYAVLGKRGGRILHGDLQEGSTMFEVTALLPVVESFDFANEVRRQTSGLALPQLVFSGWETLRSVELIL